MKNNKQETGIYRQLSDLELMRLQERILMNCYELNDINPEDREILRGISNELFRRGLEKKRQDTSSSYLSRKLA